MILILSKLFLIALLFFEMNFLSEYFINLLRPDTKKKKERIAKRKERKQGIDKK